MSDDSSVDRVVERLRRFVREASAGVQLPSSRVLVTEMRVGPVTVQRALDTLVTQGLVETRPGVGSFVAQAPSAIRADTGWQEVSLGPARVDATALADVFRGDVSGNLQMGAGYVDSSLRADLPLARAMSRAVRRPGAWDKPPLNGVRELRAWFAGQTGADSNDVLITPGAQGSLSAVIRAVTRPGDSVLFATPSYPGALAVARSAGTIPVSVPTDECGLRPELTERAFAQTKARVLYVQPTYANPDGSVLDRCRREELLAIAQQAGAIIIEDDWARWLGHGGTVPAPLLAQDTHGHVVTICSLTKAAAPSLRVGAVIARGPVSARIADMRMVDDFFVAAPLQHAAVEFVSSPAWRSHLKSLSAGLSRRCTALSRSLAKRLPTCSFVPPKGGVSLWLHLPANVSDLDVAREAAAGGVFVYPGRHYLLGPQPDSYMRLSFAALTEQDADEAVRRLAVAVATA